MGRPAVVTLQHTRVTPIGVTAGRRHCASIQGACSAHTGRLTASTRPYQFLQVGKAGRPGQQSAASSGLYYIRRQTLAAHSGDFFSGDASGVWRLRRRAYLGTGMGRHGLRLGVAAIFHTDTNEILDYYKLFGLDMNRKNITLKEIKMMYHSLAKELHPDTCKAENAAEMCVILNEAYATLTDDARRKAYDFELLLQKDIVEQFQGFKEAEAGSEWWSDDPDEDRAVFVDEVMCIGCHKCVDVASATFRIHGSMPKDRTPNGKARVSAQWLDDEDAIQEAVDCCPTECISWTTRDELPYLEHCMMLIADNPKGLPNADTIILSRSGSGFQIVAEDPYLYAEKFRQKWEQFKRNQKKEVKSVLQVMSKIEAQRRLVAATGIAARSSKYVFANNGRANRHRVPLERAMLPARHYSTPFMLYYEEMGILMATAAYADLEGLEEEEEEEDNLCPVEGFTVTLVDASGTESILCCPSDAYILDAALDAGFDLPYSCRLGACPSCAATLVDDEKDAVDQSEQKFLKGELLDMGYVMTCRAKATRDITLRTGTEKALLTNIREIRKASRAK